MAEVGPPPCRAQGPTFGVSVGRGNRLAWTQGSGPVAAAETVAVRLDLTLISGPCIALGGTAALVCLCIT